MLSKLLLSSLAAAAVAGSALAADLPSRKAPPVAFAPPPVFTWSGLYVGVNGGAIWTNSNNVVTTAADFGAAAFPTVSTAAAAAASNIIPTRRTGFLVGGTWGYNWQLNSLVLGTESDFQGVFNGCNNNNNNGFGFGGGNNNCGGTAIGIAPIVGAAGFTVQSQQTINRSFDYLSTSRVRAGFLITPSLLIYGTGGVAIGHVRVNSSIISSVTPLPFALTPGLSTANYSQLKAGVVVGGGLEWMFLPNWSLKAEALYYDLGRSTFTQNFVSTTAAGVVLSNTGTQTTWRNNGIIARGGLNYHIHWFDAAPVVARY
jgi:outer membrane immunogenic protein